MDTTDAGTSPTGAALEFLPTEVALLLLASGGKMAGPDFERLARRPIDWPRLTSLAFQSHATPVLWRQLGSVQGLKLPRESAELQSLAVLNEFRLRHIAQILSDVVNRLASAGIEVMLLKGAAILSGAASKRLERTMGDLDLLVVKGSPDQAWRLCREAGWQVADERTEDAYSEHHHLPPLNDPFGVEVALELHRSLFPPGNRLLVDEAAFVARGRRIALGNAWAIIPSLEDLLLHACLHFAWSHALEVGAWRTFADAHVIVADPGFSWERFVSLVESTNGASYCYWPLRLAKEGARLQVPEHVLDRLRPDRPAWVLAALERHFFARMYDQRIAELPVRLNQLLWRLATRSRDGQRRAIPPWALGANREWGPTPDDRTPRSLVTRSRHLALTFQYLLSLLRPPHRGVSSSQ